MRLTLILSVIVTARPKFPSNADLERMRDEAESLGEAACDMHEPLCAEYRKYWKIRSPSRNTDIEGIKSDSIRKAKERGFGKLLMIMVGQTFRGGGHNDKASGTSSSVRHQKDAAESHLAFARYMQYRFGIHTDFIVETYPSKHIANLYNWYPNGSVHTTPRFKPKGEYLNRVFRPDLMKSMLAYETLLNLGLSHARNFSDYGAVLFVRADVKLKPGFFHYFDLFDRITFPFICELPVSKLPSNDRPQIGDLIAYVPSSFFQVFRHKGQFKLYHDAYNFYRENTTGFMVNSYHGTNSEIVKNPLYYIVNRKQADVVQDVGRTYDDFDGIWDDDDSYKKLTDENYPTPDSQPELELDDVQEVPAKDSSAAVLGGVALLGGAAFLSSVRHKHLPGSKDRKLKQPVSVDGYSCTLIILIVILCILALLLIAYLLVM